MCDLTVQILQENASQDARPTTPLPSATEQLPQAPAPTSPLSQSLQQPGKAPIQQPVLPPVKVPQGISALPGQSSLAPSQATAATSPNVRQQQGLETQSQSRSTSSAAAAFPEALSDLVTSFDNVKQKGLTDALQIDNV